MGGCLVGCVCGCGGGLASALVLCEPCVCRSFTLAVNSSRVHQCWLQWATHHLPHVVRVHTGCGAPFPTVLLLNAANFAPKGSVQAAIMRSSAFHTKHHRAAAPASCRHVSRRLSVSVQATSTLDRPTADASWQEPVSGPTICVPEDLQLPTGTLSTIDRVGLNRSADVFRCVGCTKAECQVRADCTHLCSYTDALASDTLQLQQQPHQPVT